MFVCLGEKWAGSDWFFWFENAKTWLKMMQDECLFGLYKPRFVSDPNIQALNRVNLGVLTKETGIYEEKFVQFFLVFENQEKFHVFSNWFFGNLSNVGEKFSVLLTKNEKRLIKIDRRNFHKVFFLHKKCILCVETFRMTITVFLCRWRNSFGISH